MNELKLVSEIANTCSGVLKTEFQLDGHTKVILKRVLGPNGLDMKPFQERQLLERRPGKLDKEVRKNFLWNGWTYLSLEYRDFQKGWFITHGIQGETEYDHFVGHVEEVTPSWIEREICSLQERRTRQFEEMERLYKSHYYKFSRDILTGKPEGGTICLDIKKDIHSYYDGIRYNRVRFTFCNSNSLAGSIDYMSLNCDDLAEASVAFEKTVVMEKFDKTEVLANMSSELRDAVSSRHCREFPFYDENSITLTGN